jgi:hypothetical protein
MKATSHLSAARAVSLALLTTAYFAIGMAWQNHSYVRALAQADGALADMFARQAFEERLTNPLPRSFKQDSVAILVEADDRDAQQVWVTIATEQREVRYLSASQFIESKTSKDAAVVAGRQLLTVAKQVKLKVDPDSKDPVALYSALNELLFRRDVTLPIIGIAVQPQSAACLLATLGILFMVMIRSGLRAALKVSDAAQDEPWLMVDGASGLARLVGDLWLAGVLLAPLVVCVTGTLTLQDLWRSAGSHSSVVAVAAPFATLGFLAMGTWVGLTLAGDVLALRSRRSIED